MRSLLCSCTLATAMVLATLTPHLAEAGENSRTWCQELKDRDAEVEVAIARACRYLRQLQSSDGKMLSFAPYMLEQRVAPLVTARVIEALHVAQGDVLTDATAGGQAIAWLMSQQDADGAIGLTYGPKVLHHLFGLPNHLAATHALALAATVSPTAERRAALDRAIAYANSAQNPGLGWHHGPTEGKNNTWSTAWGARAYAAAGRAGATVASDSTAGVHTWFARARTGPDRKTKQLAFVGYERPRQWQIPAADFGIGQPEDKTVLVTAWELSTTLAYESELELIAARAEAKQGHSQPSAATVRKWAKPIVASAIAKPLGDVWVGRYGSLERGTRFDLETWRATAALLEPLKLRNEPDSLRWRRDVVLSLLTHQEADPNNDTHLGSWPPNDALCGAVFGRAYATATAVLILHHARLIAGSDPQIKVFGYKNFNLGI